MSGRIEINAKVESNIMEILSTLPDYCTSYYYSIATGCSPKTCETYLKQIRGFLKYIHEDASTVSINEINETNIGKYLLSIQRKECQEKIVRTSFSYQKTVWSSLNGLCTYLMNKKYIDYNPIASVKRNPYTDTVKRIELNQDDLKKLLKVIDDGVGSQRAMAYQEKWKARDKAILALFISTGMRCTALTEIDLGDINFEEDTLEVVDKREVTHEYYISNSLKKLLFDWIEKRSELDAKTDALFVSNQKKRMSSKSVYNLVEKYSLGAIGTAISPHKLRAAFCTILYNETHDIEFVRDAVGHKSVSTTSRYIVKGGDTKKKAAKKISGLIFE